MQNIIIQILLSITAIVAFFFPQSNNQQITDQTVGVRTDSAWNDRTTYLETAFSTGRNILINGTSKYLNFNTTVGSSGYGFRDDSGTLQFKNSGGSWAAFGAGSVGDLNDLGDVIITASSTGDILYNNAVGKWVNLPAGSNGTVLKMGASIPEWGTDNSGSGGGSGLWATNTPSTLIYPTDTTDVVVIGSNASGTLGNILEVQGNANIANLLTVNYVTATSTEATSTFPNLKSTGFAEITRANIIKWASQQGNLGLDLTDDGSDLTLHADVGGINQFVLATDGTFMEMTANPGPSNGYEMFAFEETQGADTAINFYEGGTGNNRIWNSGSMRIGGGAGYLCSNLTSLVDCDTSATGADLVLEDDIWFGGSLISTSTKNSYLTGNFGIGSSSPAYKLSVNGSGYLDGGLTLSDLTATGTISFPTDSITDAMVVDTITASNYQPLDSDLTALAGLSGTGLVARTAANTYTERTLTESTNDVAISNGDGVSGNPTFTFSRAAAIGSNPALSANHATFGSTGIVFEGSSADTNETLLTVSNPGSDITLTLPATTGTVALLTSAMTGTFDGNNFGGGAIGQGDILYGSAAGTISELAKDANATRYLSNTGASNNPAWAQVNLSNGVTGTLPPTNISLTKGYFLVGDDNGVAQATSSIFVSSTGNIGIGTTSPETLFSINGIANFRTATTTFSSTGGIDLSSGCFAINGVCVGAGSGATTFTGLTDTPANYSSANGKWLAVNQAGNAIEFVATSTLVLPFSQITGTVPVSQGGTNITSYTAGDILYANTPTSLTTLASSTAGKVLQLSYTTGKPEWVATSTWDTPDYWTKNIYGQLLFNGGTAAGQVAIGYLDIPAPTYTLDVTGNIHATSYVDASYFTATSTSATSTLPNLSATSMVLTNKTNCGKLYTDSNANVVCGTDATGGTSAYDAWTHPAAGKSATTSEIWVSTFISQGSSTINTLNLGNALTVANGGTGATSLSDGFVILGNGTGALQALDVTGNGSIVIGDGTTDPTTLAAFTSATGALKHEYGGIEANISAITTGGLLRGASSGAMEILALGTPGHILGVTGGQLGYISTSTIPVAGDVTGTLGSLVLGTVATTKGGTNLTSYNPGDILYASAANTLSALASGTASQVLKINATTGQPNWAADSTGTANFGDLGDVATSSDATGDIYYLNSAGNLVNLGIGASSTVLTTAGTTPKWQQMLFNMVGGLLDLATQVTGLLANTFGGTGQNSSSWNGPVSVKAGTWEASSTIDSVYIEDAYLLNTGDIGTGVYDFGGATSFEIPNGSNPTLNAIGEIGINTASSTYDFYDGSEIRVLTGKTISSTIYASSTLAYDGAYSSTGTTTYMLANYPFPVKINSLYAKLSKGSGQMQIEIGNGISSSTVPCTTSGVESLTEVNFSARSNYYIAIGSQSGTPSLCTVTDEIQPIR